MGIFDSIISFFLQIFEFFTNFIDSIVTMITFIKGAFEVPVRLIPYMPSIAASCIMIVCGIAVVKIIVGR